VSLQTIGYMVYTDTKHHVVKGWTDGSVGSGGLYSLLSPTTSPLPPPPPPLRPISRIASRLRCPWNGERGGERSGQQGISLAVCVAGGGYWYGSSVRLFLRYPPLSPRRAGRYGRGSGQVRAGVCFRMAKMLVGSVHFETCMDLIKIMLVSLKWKRGAHSAERLQFVQNGTCGVKKPMFSR
jgi:hypothetical protein